jgi:hypothetical protein
MKQITRFSIRVEGQTKYACLWEEDRLIPNLTQGSPVKIHGIYYFVRFVETHITEEGDIMQFVILKSKE